MKRSEVKSASGKLLVLYFGSHMFVGHGQYEMIGDPENDQGEQEVLVAITDVYQMMLTSIPIPQRDNTLSIQSVIQAFKIGTITDFENYLVAELDTASPLYAEYVSKSTGIDVHKNIQ